MPFPPSATNCQFCAGRVEQHSLLVEVHRFRHCVHPLYRSCIKSLKAPGGPFSDSITKFSALYQSLASTCKATEKDSKQKEKVLPAPSTECERPGVQVFQPSLETSPKFIISNEPRQPMSSHSNAVDPQKARFTLPSQQFTFTLGCSLSDKKPEASGRERTVLETASMAEETLDVRLQEPASTPDGLTRVNSDKDKNHSNEENGWKTGEDDRSETNEPRRCSHDEIGANQESKSERGPESASDSAADQHDHCSMPARNSPESKCTSSQSSNARFLISQAPKSQKSECSSAEIKSSTPGWPGPGAIKRESEGAVCPTNEDAVRPILRASCALSGQTKIKEEEIDRMMMEISQLMKRMNRARRTHKTRNGPNQDESPLLSETKDEDKPFDEQKDNEYNSSDSHGASSGESDTESERAREDHRESRGASDDESEEGEEDSSEDDAVEREPDYRNRRSLSQFPPPWQPAEPSIFWILGRDYRVR